MAAEPPVDPYEFLRTYLASVVTPPWAPSRTDVASAEFAHAVMTLLREQDQRIQQLETKIAALQGGDGS